MFECGHFCIRYVLKKDKKKLNVYYEKQFMSMQLVCNVLKEYYPNVKCYRVTDLRKLEGKRRFITLLSVGKNRYHYVVVEKIENGMVFYYDPAFLFLKKDNLKKFSNKWSHYCCFF